MARRRYLVGYDIREPARLRQTHKTMQGFGVPLQYSLFVCDLDAVEKVALKAALGNVITFTEDSVAIIDLGDPVQRGVTCFEFMGVRQPLPMPGATIV